MNKYVLPSAIAILLLLLGLKQCQYNKAKDQNQLQSVRLATANDSVLIFKSKNGDITSKLSSIQVEKDNAKKALELAGFEIKDLRSRDIKWRDVVFALKAELAAYGSGTTVIRDSIFLSKTDTIHSANFKWDNKFLFLNGSIIEKQMKFNYIYKTPISLISEKKGSSYVISAYLGDPNASVISANSITIVPKKVWWGWKWLGFGTGIGVGYLIFK